MRISDWSSDVCSSDLSRQAGAIDPAFPRTEARTEDSLCTCHRGSTPAHGVGTGTQALAQRARDLPGGKVPAVLLSHPLPAGARVVAKIGRASCGERGCQDVVITGVGES